MLLFFSFNLNKKEAEIVFLIVKFKNKSRGYVCVSTLEKLDAFYEYLESREPCWSTWRTGEE